MPEQLGLPPSVPSPVIIDNRSEVNPILLALLMALINKDKEHKDNKTQTQFSPFPG